MVRAPIFRADEKAASARATRDNPSTSEKERIFERFNTTRNVLRPWAFVPLGTIATGKHSVQIEYSLTYNSGTAAVPGDGFGFTYDQSTRSPSADAGHVDFP
jgi:hypothetical protein